MPSDENWTRLLDEDALSPGEMVSVEVGEHRLAVYNVDGRFYATQNVCTHQFAILTDGWLDGCVVECPLHGGRFDVGSGAALCEPAELALRTYPVRVSDGGVDVLLGESDPAV